MSWEINTYEELKINNTDGKAVEAVAKLAEYIELLKIGVSLEAGFFKLMLQVDGETAELLDDEMLYHEDGEELTSRIPKEHALLKLAEKLETARDISFFGIVSAVARASKVFGLGFWGNYLEEKRDVLSEVVTYRCLEYYDVDSEVATFIFNADMCDAAAYDATAEDVTGVESWFCNNFNLGPETAEDLDDDTAEELMEMLREFADEYELDEPEEFFEDYPNFQYSMSLSADRVEDFAAALGNIAKAFREHGLAMSLQATFVPDGGADLFGAMDFVVKDGAVQTLYCRF